MERIKHVLILLSLTLFYGNVNGQDRIKELTNLACKIDKSVIGWYEADYALFKIRSPVRAFRGSVEKFTKVRNLYIKLEGSFFLQNSIGLTNKEIIYNHFDVIDRQSLELKMLINNGPLYKTVSVCEIVSESKMKQLEKELVDEYNKGNQI